MLLPCGSKEVRAGRALAGECRAAPDFPSPTSTAWKIGWLALCVRTSGSTRKLVLPPDAVAERTQFGHGLVQGLDVDHPIALTKWPHTPKCDVFCSKWSTPRFRERRIPCPRSRLNQHSGRCVFSLSRLASDGCQEPQSDPAADGVSPQDAHACFEEGRTCGSRRGIDRAVVLQ